MNILRFAHPEYLNALYLIALFIIIFIFMMRWRKKAMNHFGELSLIQKLFPDYSRARIIYKFILVLLAYIFVIIGIADPQIGSKLEEVKRQGVDIMIALDVSNSMKAEDIRPNRLERAKQAISKLINKLQNDRIGIIVFAGKAYTQLPITTDYGAAKLFLSTIDSDIIPTQGTAIGDAIDLAVEAFPKDEMKNKAVVVITDGENHEDDAISAARHADSAGVIVHTIGMGSPSGGPIPVYYNGAQVDYKKDNAGNVVVTKLDESLLQQIAAAGNGVFVRASNSEDGLREILNQINKMQKKNYGSKLYTDYEDRFQYFLGIALILLLLELLLSERKSKWLNKLNLFGEK
jgi:Ca-activated chloride channel homolog